MSMVTGAKRSPLSHWRTRSKCQLSFVPSRISVSDFRDCVPTSSCEPAAFILAFLSRPGADSCPARTPDISSDKDRLPSEEPIQPASGIVASLHSTLWREKVQQHVKR